MSATITSFGYLATSYLTYDYLAEFETWAYPSQVTHVINDEHSIDTQLSRTINSLKSVKSEVDRIVDTTKLVKSQLTQSIDSLKSVKSQVNFTAEVTKDNKSQVNRLILDLPRSSKMELRQGKLLHEICEDSGYLVDPYLTLAYLTTQICVHAPSQVLRFIGDIDTTYTQTAHGIDRTKSVKSQVQWQITLQRDFLSQFDRISSVDKGSQVLFALYNTTNLRILKDFPSRGTGGTNWTANSTASGDFSPYNLNTDIVEQVWRSASGVKTGLTLTCDTQVTQGIFMDTLGILNHNLTRSATVDLQASNDAGFGSIPFQIELSVIDEPNIYYIAPSLPVNSYRYWRFIINDSTNTADAIQIGTIVFGSSEIFQGECFVDQVQRSTRHFSDKVMTEGFTNVSNDRALKYSTQLEFRFLNFQKGNYKRIRNVFREARTSLKCLWIPTPQFPERFAVFGKLTQIPPETHKVISGDADYVSFNTEVDESL